MLNNMESEINEKSSQDMMIELQKMRESNVKKAIEEIQAVCEKYNVTQVPQVVIEGNQLGSQIIIVSKI